MDPEPSGNNCGWGGWRISTGRDTNNNGTLDAGEVSQTGYVCNGTGDKKYAFVTSTTISGGSVNGLGGADKTCQDIADRTPALQGGVFRAWLSSSTASAASRVTLAPQGGYWRMDGTRIAFNLGSGSLLAALDRNESNAQIPNSVVWTQTNTDGSWSGNASPYTTCSDWSSYAGYGLVGVSAGTNATWTNAGPVNCESAARLYCFQQ
jgi:hypothetical protein